jgi:hypothetical protein
MLCSSGAIAVDIEAVPGFGGACKTGSWVPITVRLKNPTNENISGAIALVDPLTRQPSSQITPFDLPGSSEKRYTHYVLLAQPGGEITVRLVPGDGRLPEGNLQTKVQSTAIADNGTLVVAAGSPKANLNFLSGEKIRIWAPPYAPASPSGGAPAKQVNTIQTGLAKPADLPDRPLGYDGVELMVRDNRRYAKRQFTWFKADPRIHWIDILAVGGPSGATEEITRGWREFLEKSDIHD